MVKGIVFIGLALFASSSATSDLCIPAADGSVPKSCVAAGAGRDASGLLQSKVKIQQDTGLKAEAVPGFTKVVGTGSMGSGYCTCPGRCWGLGVFEEGEGGNSTMTSCASRCLDMPDCSGFNVAPHVHLKCHLFAVKPETTGNNWGWECFSKDDAPQWANCIETGPSDSGMFTSGDIEGHIDNISDASACQKLCQEHPECGVFVYSTRTKKCWRKCSVGVNCASSVNGATTEQYLEAGVMAGPKFCPPPVAA